MSQLNERMTVGQIVLDHSECASVFRRHRIDYCCKGELPLADACAQRGQDSRQVLAELERAIDARQAPPDLDPRNVSTELLVDHLVSWYHRSARESLPSTLALAKKVARVHGAHNAKLGDLRDAVEELSDVLTPHLDHEEEVLFPALVAPAGRAEVIATELCTMHADHLEVAKLLERIRAASDGFTIPEWGCASYRTLMRELESLEAETFQHVHLENHVLMPRFVHRA